MSIRAKKSVRGRIQRIRNNRTIRIVVIRSNRHIGAQLVTREGKTLTTVSTNSPLLRKEFPRGKSKLAAVAVGKELIKWAKTKEIAMDHLCFDRSGFIYHGLIKALADSARESGAQF
jgi:large subunit ribosomal protein L18